MCFLSDSCGVAVRGGGETKASVVHVRCGVEVKYTRSMSSLLQLLPPRGVLSTRTRIAIFLRMRIFLDSASWGTEGLHPTPSTTDFRSETISIISDSSLKISEAEATNTACLSRVLPPLFLTPVSSLHLSV